MQRYNERMRRKLYGRLGNLLIYLSAPLLGFVGVLCRGGSLGFRFIVSRRFRMRLVVWVGDWYRFPQRVTLHFYSILFAILNCHAGGILGVRIFFLTEPAP